MRKKIFSMLVSSIVAIFILQVTACGTLMYPERRGQKHGEIDVKVALLDGIGLFFMIVPGLVAYIVDFTTGAIYLPAGQKNTVMVPEDMKNVRVIYADREQLNDPEYIKELISKEYDLPENVNWDGMQRYSLDYRSDSYRTFSVMNSTQILTN